jgi:uncharacterized membrane protein
MPGWRQVAATAAFAAYALASCAFVVWWPNSPWATAFLVGPLLLGLLGAGLGQGSKVVLVGALLAVALVAVLLAAAIHFGGFDAHLLYVVQHAAIHAALGWTFGVTLRPGATPLITMMAARIHREFTPAMRAYTRWLTGAWAVYFAAMIAASLLLYLLAPWRWWSFFYTVITPAAAALFFVGEYVLRYWRHPEFEHVSLAQIVQAWRTK